MAIERRPATPVDGLIEQDTDEELSISIENPDSVAIATDDGGMIIDFDPDSMPIGDEGFNSNLAEFMDEDKLQTLGNDLISAFNGDKESRSEWEETYTKGLDQLGLKIEERTTPWAGACGVFHPMLSEAVIRFQSQAITEIFPAQGPVRTKIVGKITSAVYSPRLERNIALAIVEIDCANLDQILTVNDGNSEFNAVVVNKPFYDPNKNLTKS